MPACMHFLIAAGCSSSLNVVTCALRPSPLSPLTVGLFSSEVTYTKVASCYDNRVTRVTLIMVAVE